jgi:hypothetical protein
LRIIMAILFIIGIVYLYFTLGGPRGLRGLFIMLIPLCYSVNNMIQQKRLVGSWTIKWGKFWMAFALQLLIIGFPAYIAFSGETYPYNLAIPGFAAYFILTSVAYGVAKIPT